MGHLAKTNQTAELPSRERSHIGLFPGGFFFPEPMILISYGIVSIDTSRIHRTKTWRVTKTFLGCLALHLQTGRQQKAQPGETRS